MTANPSAVAAYRSALARVGQSVTFTRVNGQPPNTATFSATVNAVVNDDLPDMTAVSRTGFSESKRGAITQGDRKVIVLGQDLADARFPLPLRKNDKAVIGGETFNVTLVDPYKRDFSGAIELTVTGVA